MSPRKHAVLDEPLDNLWANYRKPEDLIGENGLLKQLTEQIGHDKHEPVANAAGTPTTVAAARRSKVSSANFRSRFRVIAMATSSCS